MNVIDELIIFLARVSVVESEISFAAVGLGNLKVEANRLGVADVKISIWFGREPGVHLTLSEGTVCSKDLGGVPNVDIATNQF